MTKTILMVCTLMAGITSYGAVKGKLGKPQTSLIEVLQHNPTTITPNTSWPVEMARIVIPEGTWDLSATMELRGQDSSAFGCPCYTVLMEFAGGSWPSSPYPKNGYNALYHHEVAYATTNVVMPEQRVKVAAGATKTFYLTTYVTSHSSGNWVGGNQGETSWIYIKAKLVK